MDEYKQGSTDHVCIYRQTILLTRHGTVGSEFATMNRRPVHDQYRPLSVGPFAAPNTSRTRLTNRKRGVASVIDVPGLYVESRDAPERMTRNLVDNNRNWKKVEGAAITAALDFFDSDKFVQDAVSMKLNHILGAGVTFRRKFETMTPEATRWHSNTYTALLRGIYRYWLACGIAAWSSIPHADYVGQPVILDLQKVDIFMLRDLWSHVHLKFFPKKDDPMSTDMKCDLEIENVQVLIFKPPDANGNIKSIADVLKADYQFEIDMQNYAAMACKLKCMPPIVSQQQTERQTPADHFSSYGIGQAGATAAAAAAAAGAGGVQIHAPAIQDHDERVRIQMKAQNGHPARNVEDYRRFNSAHELLARNQVFMDPDRTVARVEMAQEPLRYIEFSRMRRDNVFAFFSIPPGIVAAGGGSSSDRSQTTGSSANSMTVFINDQKQLKNRFIGIIQDIYSAITHSVDVLQLVIEGARDRRQKMNTAAIQAYVDTEIEMPGIPEDIVVLQLYMLGMLTYESLCATMGGKHGLTKSSFNPKPAIDIKLLNGIKPEPPKVPSSSNSRGH
jgi:hypothetical protein